MESLTSYAGPAVAVVEFAAVVAGFAAAVEQPAVVVED